MKRRDFLQASAVALATPAILGGAETDGGALQYYEWRTYQLSGLDQQRTVLDYLQQALPSFERLRIGPVGVFTEIGEKASESVHVLISYQTIELLAGAREAHRNSAAFQNATADYFNAPMKHPAFDRIESSLMVAFVGQPQLSVPERKERVFELREYQSHSEAKARRKIEMFNNGEIPIFRSVGFETVYFGETLIGSRLPNLKYMLAAESLEACRLNFDKFRVHPDWLAMKDLPEYAETVSAVVQTFLAPAAFSQI